MSKNIKFKYIFSDDYNPDYINGAYGGIGPRGEIIANFFLERQALPISETNELNDSGDILKPANNFEPDDLKESFVRYVKVGIVMNLTTAERISEWLIQHIEKLKKIDKIEREKIDE